MCLNDFYSTLCRVGTDDTLVVCPKDQEEAFNILQHSRPFIWKQIKEASQEKASLPVKQKFILVSLFIEKEGVAKIAEAAEASEAVAHSERIVVGNRMACGYDSTLKLEHSNISVTCHK